jgi:hypothetical protein
MAPCSEIDDRVEGYDLKAIAANIATLNDGLADQFLKQARSEDEDDT